MQLKREKLQSIGKEIKKNPINNCNNKVINDSILGEKDDGF